MRAGRLLIAAALVAACSRRSPTAGACDAPELKLERALPIDGELEPSGLLLDAGKLLMVADKHDGAIFELRLDTQKARAQERVNLLRTDGMPLDLEGIARDRDGSWLLASEAQGRVLRVTPDGTVSWATASLQPEAAKAGLLAKRGAGLEGVAVLGSGALLLAAEREPRGLLESGADRREWRTQAMARARCPAPHSRPNDWADLTVWQDRVFGLARNAHLVVELRKEDGAWHEARAWSYRLTEDDPRFAYEDRRFGLAEGLAIDDRHLYLVLDNNGTARVTAPTDHRALLLVFRRPD